MFVFLFFKNTISLTSCSLNIELGSSRKCGGCASKHFSEAAHAVCLASITSVTSEHDVYFNNSIGLAPTSAPLQRTSTRKAEILSLLSVSRLVLGVQWTLNKYLVTFLNENNKKMSELLNKKHFSLSVSEAP